MAEADRQARSLTDDECQVLTWKGFLHQLGSAAPVGAGIVGENYFPLAGASGYIPTPRLGRRWGDGTDGIFRFQKLSGVRSE
jgi:hypothetical protein